MKNEKDLGVKEDWKGQEKYSKKKRLEGSL